MTTTTNTWLERVKTGLLGENGVYREFMRRSLQTLIIYEANRVLINREDYEQLKPFQRRHVLHQTALALVDSIDFVPPPLQETILWKTMTVPEVMDQDISWRRAKSICKEVEGVADLVEHEIGPDHSHHEVCQRILLYLLRRTSPHAKIPPPADWEHRHCHYFTTYKIYYRGYHIDPTFPEPYTPHEIMPPIVKDNFVGDFLPAQEEPARSVNNVREDPSPQGTPTVPEAAEERQRRLDEVQKHLLLLKEFEGVIPAAELIERKRQLFASLPDAPPPTSGKKTRLE